MATSLPLYLAVLTILCLTRSSAVINGNKVIWPQRTLQSGYDSDSYRCRMCQQCPGAGIKLGMLVCCKGTSSAAVCHHCWESQNDPDSNTQEPPRLEFARVTVAGYADNGRKYRHARKRHNNNFDYQNSLKLSDAQQSFKETSADSKSEPRYQVGKRWYSPYKYILSLFPQRLSYGHSVFLQGIMAHRPKNNSARQKMTLAWMKRSGDEEEKERENADFHKNRKGPREWELNKNDDSSADETRHDNYYVVPSDRPTYNKLLHDEDKENSKKIRFVTGIGHHFRTATEPIPNLLEKVQRKRGFISSSDLAAVRDSVLELPWPEIVAKMYSISTLAPTEVPGHISRSDYFFAKLLLFVETMKQNANEFYQNSQRMNSD